MLPLLPWKSNKYYIFWVYVCSLIYPACKAHASCYIVNGTIFRKKESYWSFNAFWLSLHLFWNISHSKKNPVTKMCIGLYITLYYITFHIHFKDPSSIQWRLNMEHVKNIYRISRTFSPEKCYLNSTCFLCAEGKYYFQTYKYPYIYYTSLSWDNKICFQIMRSGITACERLTFLFGDLP